MAFLETGSRGFPLRAFTIGAGRDFWGEPWPQKRHCHCHWMRKIWEEISASFYFLTTNSSLVPPLVNWWTVNCVQLNSSLLLPLGGLGSCNWCLAGNGPQHTAYESSFWDTHRIKQERAKEYAPKQEDEWSMWLPFTLNEKCPQIHVFPNWWYCFRKLWDLLDIGLGTKEQV